MLSEFEVRRHLRRIQAMEASPEDKAHMLLQLGRRMRRQARTLERAHAVVSKGQDSRAMMQLDRLARIALGLHEEIRHQARRNLHPRTRAVALTA
jgi:hypothetical protein